jgi:hypothetical protein
MRPPKGGPIGANGDEQGGVGAGRGAGAGAERAVASGGRGGADGRQLPAREAAVEAVPGGRGGRAEAPQRGGRRSHRAYAEKFRQKVLGLVREKYGGPPACAARIGERFGPTLAAEHLASEMPRRCGAGCCKGGYGAGSGGGGDTGGGASARSTLGRWCRWTEAFTRGWRSGDRKGA